ncbi:MAG TPA: 3'-5' exonuclease [Williamwhitmania sp.]|nr:3'-5' exonuclease [Williamwhitmania sp.]
MVLGFKQNIEKEELELLPFFHFEGKIITIDTPEEAVSAANYLLQKNALGFDTETRPSFRKGTNNHVALLQLSTAEEAFLFQLGSTGMPQQLKEVLASNNILKIGVGIKDDIRSLRALSEFSPGGFMELQTYSTPFGIEGKSLKKLSAIVLGVRISKSQQLTNWDNTTLTEAQKRYAATDAYMCLQIYNKLSCYKKVTPA